MKGTRVDGEALLESGGITIKEGGEVVGHLVHHCLGIQILLPKLIRNLHQRVKGSNLWMTRSFIHSRAINHQLAIGKGQEGRGADGED